MKWIVIVVLALVALVAIVWIAGSLMPREHRASSRITLKQPPDSIWLVVSDLGVVTKWFPEITLSERVGAGPPERWRQKMGNKFDMQFDVTERTAPTRFVTRIVPDKGAVFGGTWTYEIAAATGGSTVTVTEDGWVGPPPFRVMSRLMGQHSTMDTYLRALSRKFGETTAPVHVP